MVFATADVWGESDVLEAALDAMTGISRDSASKRGECKQPQQTVIAFAEESKWASDKVVNAASRKAVRLMV